MMEGRQPASPGPSSEVKSQAGCSSSRVSWGELENIPIPQQLAARLSVQGKFPTSVGLLASALNGFSQHLMLIFFHSNAFMPLASHPQDIFLMRLKCSLAEVTAI